MKYYIYGLVDPRNQQIKYIGKGCRGRMFQHVQKAKQNTADSNNFIKLTNLKEILNSGYEDIAYCKLFETDDEQEAYSIETKLIQQHNTLFPNGWNLVEKAIPPLRKGIISPMKGKNHSEETKKKISATLKENLPITCFKKGYTQPSESKQKTIETRKKNYISKAASEETKQKLSESHKGQKAWNRGLELSIEHKQKLKDNHMGMSGKKHSDSTKEKMREAWKKRKAEKI